MKDDLATDAHHLVRPIEALTASECPTAHRRRLTRSSKTVLMPIHDDAIEQAAAAGSSVGSPTGLEERALTSGVAERNGNLVAVH